MGLPALWETIRDFEEVKPIAQLAEEHFKEHGRPLRIAVDEADWRFNNLTTAQVYMIRETSSEPAFQGIEKAMFYRICKLLTLNIQLLFVFDGPGVPAKRGRNGGRKKDYEQTRLLKQLLRCFGIPYQEAPGEAEAECARMQILGMVDAVWSQDSDCLMFGCGLWLHDDRVAKDNGSKDRSKKNTKKSGNSVRIVRASVMKTRLNLDREGLVLFAMLVGGDYHPTGLPGCRPSIALAAVKEGSLAHTLCQCRNQRDCADWSSRLIAFLQTRSRARYLAVPTGFPDYKILQKYYKPKITSDDVLKGKKSLDLDAARPINERELLDVTSQRFNIWGRLYMNWVGPVLLTRSLSHRSTLLPKEVVHDIKIIQQRAAKSGEVLKSRSLQRKITFSPFGVSSLRREDFEGGDRQGMWEGKRDVLFDPTHRVECEHFPAFWLKQVLPLNILDPPPPAPKERGFRRKDQPNVDNDDAQFPIPTTRKRKARTSDKVVSVASYSGYLDECAAGMETRSAQIPKRRSTDNRKSQSTRSPPSQPGTQQKSTLSAREIIDLSHLDDDIILRIPPSWRPKKPLLQSTSPSDIVDLGSPDVSADECEKEHLAQVVHLGRQSPFQEKRTLGALRVSCDVSIPHTSQKLPEQTIPGAKAALCETEPEAQLLSLQPVPSSTELIGIRAARLKHYISNSVTTPQPLMRVGVSEGQNMLDCIDLTGD